MGLGVELEGVFFGIIIIQWADERDNCSVGVVFGCRIFRTLLETN